MGPRGRKSTPSDNNEDSDVDVQKALAEESDSSCKGLHLVLMIHSHLLVLQLGRRLFFKSINARVDHPKMALSI